MGDRAIRLSTVLALAACSADPVGSPPITTFTPPTGTDEGPSPDVDVDSGPADSSSSTTFTEPKLDVGKVDAGTRPVEQCKVEGDMDAVGACRDEAPPDSFDPDIQWTFGADRQSYVTPLVGNFTDDDGNGEIDLCDVPDVLLVANEVVDYGLVCRIHVLDGRTGAQHFAIPVSAGVSCTATPAFGDLDDDGLPEIVAVYNDDDVYRLRAFEHDGTPKWTNTTDGDVVDQFVRESGAVALFDLDADGDVEIVFNHEVYDHEGTLSWMAVNPDPGELETSIAADLDGDGMLEVITGHAAYRFDGATYFDNYPTITARAIPQVGNLDDDPEPEILLATGQGLWVVEHDGEIKYGPVLPTRVPATSYLVWQRPATIHDFDGDQIAEWAVSSRSAFAVMEGPNTQDVLWQVVVADVSGAAGSTAFDFLGDGVAEAMYADELAFRVYDGQTGEIQLEIPRGSPTISEYPVVADVDNDGSAEILVVSSSTEPALQVIRDRQDRWIQARRIWNQHAYSVTNVREDSTIPAVMTPSWTTLNTFRTNAQIEAGGVCKPVPQG